MPDDELDACDQTFDLPEKNTDDEVVDAVVLFADVDWTDEAAVEARKREYEELFGS